MASRVRLSSSLLFVLALVLFAGCASTESSGEYKAEYVALSDLNAERIERIERIVDCLSDQGFPGTEILPDGTTKANLTEEQAEGYDRAARQCLQQECPACGEPPSTETLTKLYYLQIEAAQCLSDKGFETSDAPSLQTFIESPAESRWSPHRDSIRAMARSGEMNEILESCPDPETFTTYW